VKNRFTGVVSGGLGCLAAVVLVKGVVEVIPVTVVGVVEVAAAVIVVVVATVVVVDAILDLDVFDSEEISGGIIVVIELLFSLGVELLNKIAILLIACLV